MVFSLVILFILPFAQKKNSPVFYLLRQKQVLKICNS